MAEVILNDRLEYWMARLPPSLKKIPITQLAIPGSHDTMTYSIERTGNVGPDKSQWIRTLARIFPFVSKHIIYNWSITQDKNVTDQLDGGIRYLDLRVATNSRDKCIHFLHGLYGSEVTRPLEEISKWLTSHPDEFLILDFQHFYSFAELDHQRLVKMIRDVFRGKLCPVYAKLDHVSLEFLNGNRYQLIVIYRNQFVMHFPDFWPSGAFPTPWPDTVNVNELLEFLDAGIQSRSLKTGFVSQCLLTPDTPFILKHLCGTLQRNLVAKCQKPVISWIERKQPGSGGLNIVISDYVADKKFLFSRTVIQRNAELLR